MSFVFIGTNILIIQLSEQFRPKELVTFFKACTTKRKNVLKLYCWIIILNKYKLLVITYSTASIWLLFGSALSQSGPEQHWVKAEPFPRQCSVILVQKCPISWRICKNCCNYKKKKNRIWWTKAEAKRRHWTRFYNLFARIIPDSYSFLTLSQRKSIFRDITWNVAGKTWYYVELL